MAVEPLAHHVGSATVGVSPERFAVAPVPAIAKLLKRAGLSHENIDLWEINEAFAAMVLSTLDELPEVDRDRVNVNGGAVAIARSGPPRPASSSTSPASCDVGVGSRRRRRLPSASGSARRSSSASD